MIEFEGDEVWRIERAQFLLLTGMNPDDVDLRTIYDVLEINRANDEYRAWAEKSKR